MKRATKNVLLTSLVAFAIWQSVDWDKLFDSEYRNLSKESEVYTAVFIERLQDAMQKRQHEVMLSDLTPFKWDEVCFMGGYSHLREDLRHEGYLGRDFPELEKFPHNEEGEWAYVFIQKNKTIAVLKGRIHYPAYHLKMCGNKGDSKIYFTAKNSFISTDELRKTRGRVLMSHVKLLEKCKSSDCNLIFKGGDE